MKRFMAFFLLLFLVALQLPKGVLHSHEHGDKHELFDHDYDGESFESEDCFVCELTIDSYDGPKVPLRIFNLAPITKLAFTYPSATQSMMDLPYVLRGPPHG